MTFDGTFELKKIVFRIRNPEKMFVTKPIVLTMTQNRIPSVLLGGRTRLKANESAIVSLGIKKLQ